MLLKKFPFISRTPKSGNAADSAKATLLQLLWAEVGCPKEFEAQKRNVDARQGR